MSNRDLAVIIEDDHLTLWTLQNLLSPYFDVITAATVQAAIVDLKDARVRVVICGSPVDGQLETVKRIAEARDYQVIALVTDHESRLPDNVAIVEKPFPIERLATLLRSHIAKKRSMRCLYKTT